jgi:hypothetical protein
MASVGFMKENIFMYKLEYNNNNEFIESNEEFLYI